MKKFICAQGLAAVLAGLLSASDAFAAEPASGEVFVADERALILNALVGAIRQVEQDPKLTYNFAWKDKDGKIIAGIGITQIIPSNLKRWSTECLGRALTPEEYLGNVRAQLELSYCAIGHLWDKYQDARVVAACWNSPRTDFNDDVPRDKLIPDATVKKYVALVLKKLEQGGRPNLAKFTDDWKSENKVCKW